MSRVDVVAVALRIFSVFLLLTALQMTGAVAQIAGSSSLAQTTVYIFFTVVPFVSIAALIWFFPLTLAHRFLPIAREPKEPLSGDPDRLQEVGFTVIGLWVLATGLSDSVYWISYLASASRSGIPLGRTPPDQLASCVATIAQLILGVWLMLGARGLIGALRRLRAAGG